MRLPQTLSIVPLAAVVLIGACLGAVTTGAVAVPPEPTSAPITVVIPDLSPSPTPTPSATNSGGGSSSGGNNNNGGGAGNGGNGGGGNGQTNPDGSPKPPSKPGENKPKLTLDHETIEANRFMIASTSGYAPGEKVQLVLYPGAIVIGSYLADASGDFSARFRVPADSPSGNHVVEATGWISGYVANNEFTLTTTVLAGGIPLLWWIVIVIGVILTALLSSIIYFRSSIARWFSSGLTPQGSAP